MTKKHTRIITVILAAALLLSFVAACKKDTGDEPDDFVYAPQFIEFPGEPDYINAYAFTDDKVYFTTSHQLSLQGNLFSNKIQTMNFDGTDLMELENYMPEIPDADYGGISLYAMAVDGDGNIWICEGAWLYNYNLPDDFDGEEHEKYEYSELAGSYEKLKKLDNMGNTLLSVDLDVYSKGEYSRISTLLADKDGNIFALVEGRDDGSILIFSKEGALLSKIDVSGWNNSLVRLLDGTIAHGGYSSMLSFEFSLRKIDISAGALGDKLEAPSSANKIFSGGAGFKFLYSDNNSLFGIDSQTGETELLLNWLDSGIDPNEFRNLTMLPDGRIATITSTWDNLTQSSSSSLIILTKVPRTELPNKTVLTLATFHVDQALQNAIRKFNNTNPTHTIKVIDYSEFSSDDDYFAGITRLSTEIITGNAPDIINMSGLPINQYVAKGLLLDLYELIDADPELKRDDFVSAALRAAEINGGLYQIFPFFRINTLIGRPEILGHEPGWTVEEFKAVVEANPDADFIMGLWMTSQYFLNLLLAFNMSEYVNWEAGIVNFDSDEFVQLLELASMFPAENDYNIDYIDEPELIAAGRQLMLNADYSGDYGYIQMHRAIFGGDVVFKGFPAENRQGNTLVIDSGLAITTNCTDVDGAWAFLRTLLSKEFQFEYNWWGFPTNKEIFDERLSEAMKEKEFKSSWGWGNITIEIEPTTQKEADQILALIDSASGTANYDIKLINLVTENAADFFSGRSTARDAARIIQSRAGIYISEQS